jgi:hypothetical protein
MFFRLSENSSTPKNKITDTNSEFPMSNVEDLRKKEPKKSFGIIV